jgi:cysteine desulfurase
MNRIYLDHSATTPLRDEVREVMAPYLNTEFGNAGSIHAYGRAARKAVDDARDRVAALINADPREVYFTSGGTESNNWVIQRGLATGQSLVTSSIEHHAVLHPAQYVRDAMNVDVRIVPVDGTGRIIADAVAGNMGENTGLVSIMHANNETGIVQRIEAIAATCHERGVPFHTDAVQSVGKIPFDTGEIPVTYASISAHKIYGPKGVGALFMRKGSELPGWMLGGFQERERRAGTENVAAIVGFGKAAELALQERDEDAARMAALRDELQRELLERVPDAIVHGGDQPRSPGLLNIAFPGIEGESMILGLDVEGIAVSSGSACTSGSLDPSHVLLAMGIGFADAQSAVRFSLGRGTTREEIARTIDAVGRLIQRLRTGADTKNARGTESLGRATSN